jgi:hypothetical protein
MDQVYGNKFLMSIERTHNIDLIRKIVSHPRALPSVSDDASPLPENWTPDTEKDIYLLARDSHGALLGLFGLNKQNSVCYHWHVVMLPAGYGESGRLAAKEFFDWVWKHTECIRLVGEVPKFNHLAFWFALRVGMKIFAVNPSSYLRFGKLHDMILFGMSRPGIECKSWLS